MSREAFSQALRRVIVLDLGHDKRVETYDLVTHQRHIGL
jgi:hypothetical protein